MLCKSQPSWFFSQRGLLQGSPRPLNDVPSELIVADPLSWSQQCVVMREGKFLLGNLLSLLTIVDTHLLPWGWSPQEFLKTLSRGKKLRWAPKNSVVKW